MRILVALPTLEGGGAERVIVDIATALTRIGVSTDVFVVRRTGPLTFEAQKQVQVRFGTSRNRRMRYLFPTALRAMISLAGRYDVIVGGLDNTILLAWLAGRVRRRPVVGVVHTDLRRSMKDVGSPLQNQMARFVYHRLDAVVAVSDAAAQSVLSFGVRPPQLAVVPNGVDLDRIRALASRPRPLESRPPTVLGVGRLIEAKGFDVLIQAHASVIARGVSHELRILGDGPRREDLMSLARRLGVEDSVRFDGFVTNPYSALAHSSLFCLASRYEGFPLALLEAVACGVPTVATRCAPAVSDILHGGEFGDLVPTDSVPDLADAIGRHLIDPTRLRDKARAASENAQSYSVDGVARRYASLFQRLAATGGGLDTAVETAPRRGRLTIVAHTKATQMDGTWRTFNRSCEIFNGLARVGWQVTLLAREGRDELSLSHPVDDVVRVVPLSGPGRRFRLSSWIRALRHTIDADAVLIFMPSLASAVVGILGGRRVVMYAGGAWGVRADFGRWRRALERMVARRVSRVVAAGESLVAYFDPLAVQVDSETPLVQKDVVCSLRSRDLVRREPVVGGPAIRAVFGGSILTMEKGVFELFDAFQARPDFACRIFGQFAPNIRDEALDRLKRLPNVAWSGYLEWESLRELYEWANALVVASYTEGFPRVVYEAASFELALIVTPVGGIPHRLRSGVECLYIQIGDSASIVRALDMLAEDPDLAHRLASASRQALAPVFDGLEPVEQFDRYLLDIGLQARHVHRAAG